MNLLLKLGFIGSIIWGTSLSFASDKKKVEEARVIYQLSYGEEGLNLLFLERCHKAFKSGEKDCYRIGNYEGYRIDQIKYNSKLRKAGAIAIGVFEAGVILGATVFSKKIAKFGLESVHILKGHSKEFSLIVGDLGFYGTSIPAVVFILYFNSSYLNPFYAYKSAKLAEEIESAFLNDEIELEEYIEIIHLKASQTKEILKVEKNS